MIFVLSVTETCQIDESYYKKDDEVDIASLGDKQDCDNNKWKPEWKVIKTKRNVADLFKNIGNTAISTYKDSNGWLQVSTEPMLATINTAETTILNDFLNVEATTSFSNTTAGTVLQ